MSVYLEEKKWLKDNVPENLALTGRIKSWLDEPVARLPVSCTVFRVKDSMSGTAGIEDSWLFTSHALRHAAGVAIDLSELRPKGHNNGRGLIASGVVSFAKFYSLINQELRRGGTYRNGAITLHLDFDHPDILDYLTASADELPWCKRSVYLTKSMWNRAGNLKRSTLSHYVNNGTVFLAKHQWDSAGERLYSNVCMEVLLPHRGSCLLSSINLGALAYADEALIANTFVDSMVWLCKLQGIGVMGDSMYLSPMVDKQVGLGLIGLSNYLAINDISYASFVEQLSNPDSKLPIVRALRLGFFASSITASHYGMERAFAIAPTASMAYEYKDAEGYICSPEISPPLWKTVNRNSDVRGLEKYDHHINTETTQDVDWNTQWKLLCNMQNLMDSTGKAHAISANIWNSQHIDESWIDEWLDSPLVSTYYRLDDKTQHAIDKSQVQQRNALCNEDYCEPCGG